MLPDTSSRQRATLSFIWIHGISGHNTKCKSTNHSSSFLVEITTSLAATEQSNVENIDAALTGNTLQIYFV